MRHLRAPAITLLLTTLCVGCATTGVNRGDFNLVSIEEEWQLGEKLESDLAKELTLVHDARVQGTVDEIGRRIVARTAMANLPWTFHVVRDDAINAFNTPGGHVYVNTGLIAAAPDVASFAGVMAHEISHGVARHGTEQLSKAYGFQIVAGLVLGENPATYEQILAQVVAGGTFARFSRDAEREADELGVRTMYEAGYDPGGMARMFEVLLEQRQRRPSSVEQFFSSHPLTEERIRDVRAEAEGLPARQGLVRTDAGFRAIQARVGG
ncbi:MAG: M48 family metallopeptidase [Thermoanaerobaculia bacterium]